MTHPSVCRRQEPDGVNYSGLAKCSWGLTVITSTREVISHLTMRRGKSDFLPRQPTQPDRDDEEPPGQCECTHSFWIKGHFSGALWCIRTGD